MRAPRPRLCLWMLIALVALAGGLFAAIAEHRRMTCRAEAERHADLASRFRRIAESGICVFGGDADALRADHRAMAEHHDRLARRYSALASRPWRAVGPDSPAPHPELADEMQRSIEQEGAEARAMARARQLCESLAGSWEARERFEIGEAELGASNSMPRSLRVRLRPRNPGLIDAIEWYNPLHGELDEPEYTWRALLRAYLDAEGALSRHAWVAEWKAVGPGRALELTVLGEGIGETRSELATFVLPVWGDAGLSGPPGFHVEARWPVYNPTEGREETAWAVLYLGVEERQALISNSSQRGWDARVGVGKRPEARHWLDEVDVAFHPRSAPGDGGRDYILVGTDGHPTRRTCRDASSEW